MARLLAPGVVLLTVILPACAPVARGQSRTANHESRNANPEFSVIEASIEQMRLAMEQGRTTSRDIVTQSLVRIATYEDRLNAAIMINPRALAAFGVSMRDAQRGTLQGVTGTTDTLAVRLESLEVASARVGPLMVVSHDSGPGTGDGLLGRDFLDRFTVNIDNTAGVVTLTPK